MNDEENRVEDAGALESAGLRVHSMSPRSVGDVGPAVEMLARTVGAAIPSPFGPTEWSASVDEQRARVRGDARRRRTAVMVWRRPWMTMNGDTYGSSLVALLGLDNLFGDARERYPEVTLEQVAARSPDVVLLPSEPYPFRERHLAGVAAEMPSVDVRLVDGRDLFWWGIRTPAGVESVRRACA
jgi:hypothetical protein